MCPVSIVSSGVSRRLVADCPLHWCQSRAGLCKIKLEPGTQSNAFQSLCIIRQREKDESETRLAFPNFQINAQNEKYHYFYLYQLFDALFKI